MIDALIGGKLYAAAQQRTTKNGNPMASAKLRVPLTDGDSVFVSLVAFDVEVIRQLVALGVGDALTVAGSLKPSAWIDRDGQARPSLDMVASQVLTAYSVKKKRAAMLDASGIGRADGASPTGRERPSHAAWQARSDGPPLGHPHGDDLDDGEPLDF